MRLSPKNLLLWYYVSPQAHVWRVPVLKCTCVTPALLYSFYRHCADSIILNRGAPVYGTWRNCAKMVREERHLKWRECDELSTSAKHVYPGARDRLIESPHWLFVRLIDPRKNHKSAFSAFCFPLLKWLSLRPIVMNIWASAHRPPHFFMHIQTSVEFHQQATLHYNKWRWGRGLMEWTCSLVVVGCLSLK